MKLDSFEAYLALHSDYVIKGIDAESGLIITDLQNRHAWELENLAQNMYMLISCIHTECYYFFIENRNYPIDLTRMLPREEDPGISKMIGFIKLYENENENRIV